MRDSHIRDITFLDLLIQGDPAHCPLKDMRYFTSKVEELYNAGQTARWNREENQKLYIRDLYKDTAGKYIVLLLCYNNGNAAPASYAHLDTDHQRIIAPQTREGRPESAHLLIKMDTARSGQHRYLALLEESSRIHRAAVQIYLNFLFREIKKANPTEFEHEHPDGSRNANGPRKYKYINKFIAHGHPSSAFRQMLTAGKLTGIALEADTNEHFNVADGSSVIANKKEIKLTPVSGSWKEHPIKRLNDSLKIGRDNNLERLRITFVAADDRPHTAYLDVTTGRVLGDNFIEKKRLSDFTYLLPDADTSINEEIKNKIIELL